MSNRKKQVISVLSIVLIFVIFAFALTIVLAAYRIGGIRWDFVAEVLYAKSLLTAKFYSAFFNGNLGNAISYENSFYFETLRPPLIGVLMLPFMALGTGIGVPLYLTFALLLLLASLLYLSKSTKTDPLLITLLFFTPCVIFFFLMLNGAEIVSMSFLLVFIGLVFKKRWESGIFLAIAGLAKYDSLIFLLLLLVMPDKVRKKAFVAFMMITLPWLIFNTITFHNPVWSYLTSINSFSGDAQGLFSISIIVESLKLVLPYLLPAFLIFMIALLARHLYNKKKDGITNRIKINYRYKVVFASLLVGSFGWLLTAVSGSINDLPREAYLVYLGIALALIIAITDLSDIKVGLPFGKDLHAYLAVLLFLITVGMLVYAYNSLYTDHGFGAYGSTNPIYKTVANSLASQGLGGCDVVSNDWVYLIYAGIKAHSPYYYNSSIEHYPIVFFTDMGSNNSPINFNNVTRTVNFTNFYIAFPKNYTCN